MASALIPMIPQLAVVTLNRLMLERVMADASSLMIGATQEFNRAIERVQIRAGSVIAQELREAVASVRTEMQRDIDSARLDARELIHEIHRAQSQSRRWWPMAFGLMAGAGLFAAGVFAGMFLR